MSTALLIVVAAVLVVVCGARLGLLNPVSITAVLWLCISVLIAVRPFHIIEPSLRVSVVISSGLVALCLPPLLLSARRRTGAAGASRTEPPAHYRLTVRPWALGTATLVVLLASFYGLLQYRSAVSSALGGTPFSQLDPQLVRWAELYGNAKLSTTAGVALGLTPLLGCIAVIGGLCHRWWWYLLLPAALLIVSQSPSRTTTLGIVVGSGYFFVRLARGRGGPLQMRSAWISVRRLAALGVTVGALALGYFSYIGNALSKSAAAPGLSPARWLPSALVEPLLFQLGGVSAFTQELDHPVGPGGPYGSFGRSMYLVVKLAQDAGIHLPEPAPYAAYVDIPVSFNTYSAFGDTYFDVGLAGVIGLFLLIGLIVHLFSRWPAPGHPVSAWVLSTMVVVLADSAVNIRFLDVDIVIQAVVGAAIVALVLRRQVVPPAEDGALPAPMEREDDAATPARATAGRSR